MSYQLSRLRLCGIGERAARFPDVTLDLADPSAGGDPLDSIVWLRNGGGKSSLLSLFFALLLPNRNDFLGKSMKRYIEDYVADGDTSHSAAEWTDVGGDALFAGGGPRLVTGAIYEWDERRKPVDPDRNRDKLKVSYYAFFATPGALTLDTLPLTDSAGNPATRTDIVRALRELGAAHPQQLQLAIADAPGDWMAALTKKNLDPELFRYQKKMNHSEGGVADMFNFDSSAKFIDFLIDLTIDSSQPDRVASNLRNVADVLASKPKHLLGLDFCTTMIGKLEAFAAESVAAQGVRAQAAQVRQQAGQLSARLSAAEVRHQQRHTELEDQLEADDARQQDDNRERNRLLTVANELQLRAARFRSATAVSALTGARQMHGQRSDEVAAWEAVLPLGEHDDAADQVAVLTEQLKEEEQRNAQPREDRDAAALALRLRLQTLTDDERAGAELARTHGEAQRSTGKQKRTEQRAADTELAKTGFSLDAVGTELDAIDADVAAAVARGDLPHADADPAEQFDRSVDVRDELAAKRSGIAAQQADRGVRRTTIGLRRTELAGLIAEQNAERSQLLEQHRALSGRVDSLATHPRLVALTQVEDGQRLDLWADAVALRASLSRAAADSDAAVINSGVDGAEDVRALAALDLHGFLPTTRDSERVAAELAGAGINARPGWELLRDLLDPAARTAALTRPHLAVLATGLVVADSDAARAAALVAAPALTAVAHVAVTTPAVFEAAVSSDHDGWHVVAPTPGLYDPHAADAARTQRLERSRDRADRERAWTEQARADRDLLVALERFLTDCPPGHLRTLERDANTAAASLERLTDEQDALAAELADLEAAVADAARRDDELVAAIGEVDDRIRRLTALAGQVARRPDLTAQRSGLQEQQNALRDTVAELDRQAAAAESAAEQATQARAEHEAAQRTYKTRAAGIVLLGGTAAAGRAASASDTDPAPLATLAARFEQAARAWEHVASTSVVAERLRTQTDRRAAAERRLLTFTAQARAAAAELLRTAGGQDEQRRERALIEARARQAAAVADVTRAEEEVRSASEEVRTAETALVRGRRTAELDVEPTDEAQARAFAADAAAAATQKSEAVTARGRKMEAAKLAQAEELRVSGLIGQYVQRLAYAAPAGDPGDAPAFDGAPEQAEQDVTDLLAAVTAADAAVKAAEDKLARVGGAVRREAGSPRFHDLESPLKDRFTNDDLSVQAEMAESRAAQLRARQEQIQGVLSEIGEDQRLVVTQVATLVSEVLSTLTTAQKKSLLPGSLGDWSNQQFLTISFSKPTSDEDLRSRIDAVIDQVVADQNKPEGVALLKRCVHEAVGPRGFRVTVLKPNSDLDVQPLDITLLGKFSGGEKLTVCVALYCTLARLRAVNRGQGHVGGTLVLDNPLGTASHIALLRLQRRVAAAHGVQLVYTTGVEDLGAVGQFPNVLRLRNSPGSLRHRRYVTVDGRMLDGVPTEPASGADAGIGGVRVRHLERSAG